MKAGSAKSSANLAASPDRPLAEEPLLHERGVLGEHGQERLQVVGGDGAVALGPQGPDGGLVGAVRREGRGGSQTGCEGQDGEMPEAEHDAVSFP